MKGKNFLIVLFAVFITLIFNYFSFGGENITVKKYAVAIENAEVRVLPAETGDVVFTARVGEKMEIIEDLGKWLKIRRETGVIGYINARSVRIEIEKIVKEQDKKEKSKPAEEKEYKEPTSPENPNSPANKGEGGKIEFGMNFEYGLISPDDFNAPVEGINKYFSIVKKEVEARGYEYELSEGLKKLENLLGGSGELRYFFNKYFAFNLGFGFYSGSAKGETKGEIPTEGDSLAISIELKSTIYAPYAGLTYSIPGDKLSFDIYGNVGYFMGNFEIHYDQEDVSSGSSYTYSEDLTEMSKSSIGFIGGIRGKFKLTENMGLFFSANYRMIKFKEITGKYKNSEGDSYEGMLYYYENNFFNDWLSFVNIFEEEPNDSWRRNVRPAELDFSGIYIGGGLFFFF